MGEGDPPFLCLLVLEEEQWGERGKAGKEVAQDLMVSGWAKACPTAPNSAGGGLKGTGSAHHEEQKKHVLEMAPNRSRDLRTRPRYGGGANGILTPLLLQCSLDPHVI